MRYPVAIIEEETMMPPLYCYNEFTEIKMYMSMKQNSFLSILDSRFSHHFKQINA